MSSVNQEIDNFAAYWAAKRDLGELSSEETQEFESWVAADIRHLGAYGRAEAVLARVERLSGRVCDHETQEPSKVARQWNRRRIVTAGSAAASLAATLGIGSMFQDEVQEEMHSTGLGQVKELVLSDGSVVSLNTNSEVIVRFTRNLRSIHLTKGEALFDVAKNKKRPFIVTAGNTTVAAVGTSFAVSLLPDLPVQVLIREGIVELKHIDAPMASAVRVGANIHVSALPGAPILTQAISHKLVSKELAWQYGRISLENETLAEAANKFSRYSDIRIVLDSAVANRTVTGMFATNDPVGFAKAAAVVLNLHAEIDGTAVRISEK